MVTMAKSVAMVSNVAPADTVRISRYAVILWGWKCKCSIYHSTSFNTVHWNKLFFSQVGLYFSVEVLVYIIEILEYFTSFQLPVSHYCFSAEQIFSFLPYFSGSDKISSCINFILEKVK